MNLVAYIPTAFFLAEVDTDWTRFVTFVVLVVFAVVGAIIKRIRQGSEKPGAQQPQPPPRQAQRPYEEEAPRGAVPPPPPAQEAAPRRQALPPRPSAQAPTVPDWMRPAQPPPTRPPPPTQPSPAPSAQRQRQAAYQVRPPPAPAARAPLAPAEIAGDLAEQVDQEMVAQQQRRQRQDDDRSRRMASIHLAKAPQLGGVSHLRAKSGTLAAAPAAPAELEAAPLLELDLHDPRQLRAAMILHEIFMPPKGFRTGQEMWDL